MLTIEKAIRGDENSIMAIAQEAKFDNCKFSDRFQNGFLVWPQSESTYRQRLTKTDHFIVAKFSGEIIGFLMAYGLDILNELKTSMSYEDEILNSVINLSNYNTIFLDQMAIKHNFRRKNVALKIMAHLKENTPNSHYVGAIAHNPTKNIASINFFTKKQGFSLIEEVTQQDWVWGIYKK